MGVSSYAAVTPARDEEENLRRLAESLLVQTIRPARLPRRGAPARRLGRVRGDRRDEGAARRLSRPQPPSPALPPPSPGGHRRRLEVARLARRGRGGLLRRLPPRVRSRPLPLPAADGSGRGRARRGLSRRAAAARAGARRAGRARGAPGAAARTARP